MNDTPSWMPQDLAAALRPALDAYRKALDEHGHDLEAQGAACICGWKPERPGRYPRRQVGLHIAAAERRADVQYSQDADAAIDRLHKARKQRARQAATR